MDITKHLIENHNFTKIRKFKRPDEIDVDKYSCVLRVHIVHYLFYSEEYKYFSIAIKYDKPKGLAGGGYKQWNSIMLPRLINKIEDADELLKGLLTNNIFLG